MTPPSNLHLPLQDPGWVVDPNKSLWSYTPSAYSPLPPVLPSGAITIATPPSTCSPTVVLPPPQMPPSPCPPPHWGGCPLLPQPSQEGVNATGPVWGGGTPPIFEPPHTVLPPQTQCPYNSPPAMPGCFGGEGGGWAYLPPPQVTFPRLKRQTALPGGAWGRGAVQPC